MTAGRRDTWRACQHCGRGVTPAAVSAPYARGERAPQRRVMSQAERDLAALELAKRKGVMLGQLGQLAADDRLAEESAPVIEWFREEVKASRSGTRLDELAALLPQAGIIRRRWWQTSPAAIEAPGQYDDGEDYGDDDQAVSHVPAVTALPRQIIDHAGELARRRYWINDDAPPGGCQIIEDNGTAAPCGLARAGIFGPVHVCSPHHHALTGGRI